MAETTTILGKVMVTPKGAWSSNTEYDVLDIVTNGGGSYLAKQNVPSGTALSNTSYWLQVAEKGDKGDTATIAVGTVTTGTAGSSASIVNSGDSHDATFDFTIPRGDTGNGIASVVLLSSALNVDTYRITFTDGDHFDYNVTNASSGVWGSITGDLEDQTDLQSALDEKAFAIEKSETGSIISIDDASPVSPSALTVNIEPVQDLHGYDNPWPSGGGKNKLNLAFSNDANTVAGMTFTHTESSFTLNGTASGTSYKVFNLSTAPAVDLNTDYTLSLTISGTCPGGLFGIRFYNGSTLVQTLRCNTTDATSRTLQVTSAYDSATFTLENLTADLVFNCTIKVQLEKGSSKTDWTPYSNICPISGHTSATVTRTGKNLCSTTIGRYIWINGVRYADTTKYCAFADKVAVKGGESIVVSFTDAGTNNGVYFVFFDGETYLSQSTKWNAPWTVSVPDNANMVALQFQNSANYTTDPKISNVMLEYGSSASAYEAYNGTSVTIALGQTVYGGTLDVVNGTLTVTHKYVEYDGSNDESWSYYSVTEGNLFRIQETDKNYTITSSNIFCNMYPSTISRTNITLSGSGNRLDFVNNNYADVTAWRTALSSQPVQVVYELASAQTYTLTAQQLSLLAGDNVVWADTGDIAVTYRADTKTFIANVVSTQQQIIGTVETSTTASKNYSVNDFFVMNNTLYKVLSAIGTGGTITVGTNVVATTIAEQLTALLNA